MTTTSGACHTCKTRRIKCDETKPICQRCLKSKRICVPPSDTKQLSFSMHSENNYASGKNKRPRGPRSGFVVQQPEIDLETKALAYYSQYHLQPIRDAPIQLGGLSECVAAWRETGRKDPMVELALSSMALAVYGNTQNDELALRKASSQYYRLLQLAQINIAKVELSKLQEQDIDACLVTIFLMGRYEGVTHQRGAANPRESYNVLRTWSHHEGAMATLQVWHDKLSHNTPSKIVRETRRGQIRSAILRCRVLPEWLQDGSKYGEDGVELDYDRIIVRSVILRQSLACAQQKQSISIEHVEKLVQEAKDIDETLQAWMLSLSQKCAKSEHLLTESEPFPRKHFYSPKVYSYSQLGHAGPWCQYLTARLLVQLTYLRILELGSPDFLTYCTYREQRSNCINTLQNLADELASNVPFCLERFKIIKNQASNREQVVLNKDDEVIPYLTGLTAWPLSVASGIDRLDPNMLRWFRSELTAIGKILGDGMLLTADTEEWSIAI